MYPHSVALRKAYPIVPQGSMLSPLLFNLVVTELARQLDVISDLEFTIHAGNVTLWTHSGPVVDQQNTVQAALDTIAYHQHCSRAVIIMYPRVQLTLHDPMPELSFTRLVLDPRAPVR